MEDIKTMFEERTSVRRYEREPIGRLNSRRFLNRRAKGIKKESVCKDANQSGSRLPDGK